MKTFKEFITEVDVQTITRSQYGGYGMHYPYKEVLPKKGIYHNTPVVPTPRRKKEGDIWKDKKFVYPGIPLKHLIKGGTTR